MRIPFSKEGRRERSTRSKDARRTAARVREEGANFGTGDSKTASELRKRDKSKGRGWSPNQSES